MNRLTPRLVVSRDEVAAAVADFDCGDEPWCRAANDWIKAPDGQGVRLSMERHGTRVWLFYLGEALVGFGSLGENRWPLPPAKAKSRIGFVPQFAVDKLYQGQPKDADPLERFAARIMSHLLAAARDEGLLHVGLHVHERNVRAIAFYERIGFARFGSVEQRHGEPYLRMIVRSAPGAAGEHPAS